MNREHYGKQAIPTPQELEKDTDNKPLVITNSGFFVSKNISGSYNNIDDYPDSFVLVYQHRGSINISHKNKTFSQGTVIILPTDKKFKIYYPEEPLNERYYIFFKGYECAKLLQKLNLFDNYYFQVGDLSKAIPLFTFITNNFDTCGFDNDVFRIIKFLEILSIISETAYPFISRHQNTIIEEIACYIDKNYGEQITLDSLCKEFHISSSSINRGFKSEKKQTPIQYLNNVRIENAKLMLINTHLSISNIAIQVGFTDAFYFSRAFKNKCKMTPSQFRRIVNVSIHQ